MTSLPTPSPGNTAMFIGGLRRLREPGLLGQAFLLECCDLVFMAQRQFDIVESIQQAMLAKRCDFERMLVTVGFDNALTWKVDCQTVSNVGGHVVKQPINDRLWQHHRDQSI